MDFKTGMIDFNIGHKQIPLNFIYPKWLVEKVGADKLIEYIAGVFGVSIYLESENEYQCIFKEEI